MTHFTHSSTWDGRNVLICLLLELLQLRVNRLALVLDEILKWNCFQLDTAHDAIHFTKYFRSVEIY